MDLASAGPALLMTCHLEGCLAFVKSSRLFAKRLSIFLRQSFLAARLSAASAETFTPLQERSSCPLNVLIR